MVDRTTDTTIHVRDILDRRVRTRDTVLTTVLWVVYAYLWLPLISLGAWFVGIDYAWTLVERAGGIGNLVGLMKSFSIAVGLIACLVIGWSVSQYLRFHGRERRTSNPLPEYEDEKEFWSINDEQFDLVRNARAITVALDGDGHILSISEHTR